MAEYVMACDPGGRSGWASAVMDVDYFAYKGGGVLPMKRMGLWLAEEQAVVYLPRPGCGPLGSVRRWDVMVWESWRPFRRAGSMDWIEGSNLIYAQHVGQVRLIAMLSGAKGVEQQPKDKYHEENGVRETPPASYPQKLLDVDALSTEQHDQDARYHLWVYFFRNWFTGKVDPDDCVVVP